MNGIKMSDCKFYVDEPKRTVVCVIPNTSGLLEKFIDTNFKFANFNISEALLFSRNYEKSVYMPNSFIGKAVCAEEDKWDEDLGRKIAFARAKDKCYKSFFRRANKIIQSIDERLSDIQNDIDERTQKNGGA